LLPSRRWRRSVDWLHLWCALTPGQLEFPDRCPSHDGHDGFPRSEVVVVPDVASWLARLGLDKYIEAFTANEVDFVALRHLNDDDLRELGLPVGPRRKVLAAIVALDDDATLPAFAPAPAPPRRGAERRQLTVMFIDLVGSTELSQRLDPEELRDVIGAYQSAVSTEITRYEGHVAKLMGDGVLAYFGWPRAHEDDAERAVHAALAAATATAKLTAAAGDSLAARIGIATGVVVVGDLVGKGSSQEEAVVGETPNLAARLQALADPNTVVIADSTQRLVAGLFDMVDLGQRDLKGFATPVRAWCIAGETPAEGRFDALHDVATPLVGRAVELDILLQRWQQARAEKGQVVLLSGEPGIGKSRLMAALQERVGSEPYARLRYFCSPYYMDSALHPVVKQLERAAGLHRDDSTDAKLDKLEALLRNFVTDIAESGLLLAELLSIDTTERYLPLRLMAQARKTHTLRALIDLLKGLAARQPLMILVEDAHWIDPTTREWLDMVIDCLRELPVLLIVSFRPEYRSAWTMLSHVTALSLSRLGHDEGAAIIDRVTGGKPLPEKVRSQILAKTEGVPLFVEELTRTVIESGLLIDEGNHYVLSGPLPSLAIPSTLQDSLMARLDRLAPVKEVAQIGACIGRVFHHRLLAAVTGSDDARLARDMRQLEESELVLRRGVPPEATYTFKHALVQDTAYQSLLKTRRQQIHAVIASELETKFREIVETEPETLAHHYSAAGLSGQASSYWLKAGQQALARSANVEALAHLARGLELVASMPNSESRMRQELHLQNAMGVAMMATRGRAAPEVLHALTQARRLCEQLGDTSQLFVTLCGQSSYHRNCGNLREADKLGQQSLELARSSGDPALLLEAHHLLWPLKTLMGDYAAAETHVNFGIATYDSDRHHSLTYIYSGHDPGVCCMTWSATLLWLRGYPDQALDRCQEALALAERLAHPNTLALAQWTFAWTHLVRREPDNAQRWIDKGIALSDQFVVPLIVFNRFGTGWALAEAGHVNEGVRVMREAIAAITSTGRIEGLLYQCVFAQACGACGEAGEGYAQLERALNIATQSDAKYQLPELLRVKGELLLALNPHDDTAESCLRQAVAMARDEGTKSLELRAAVSLARLYRARGHDNKARNVLASVYDWFTEGFETRDLLEAKELLGQLP
jgi:class 3 adenylate cyclase/tetratricopeptide (TPR) repeat protein